MTAIELKLTIFSIASFLFMIAVFYISYKRPKDDVMAIIVISIYATISGLLVLI